MSEVSNKRFVHFNGTKQDFIDGGYPDQYQESIVFINGDGNESNNTIYTHGEYYGQGVIVEGDASNSAILKGEITVLGVTYKNEALNVGCVSLGANSKAGLKGYYFTYIDFNTNQIWLHDKQFTSRTLGALGGWRKNSVSDANRCGWTIGDVISFTCDGHYDNSATITNVVDNIITVDTLPFTLNDVPSTIISIEAANNKFDECSVFCVKKFNIGTVDLGGSAFAIGTNTQASNAVAYAEGYNTVAYGKYSHAEGNETKSGYNAHSEGYLTEALGERSHAEGIENLSIGIASHTEGRYNTAEGNYSHAEGNKNTVTGWSAHAEGYNNNVSGLHSHVEGSQNKVLGDYAHAEGENTTAEGNCSHAEGKLSISRGTQSHAEGMDTLSTGNYSHAEGRDTHAKGEKSHAEGDWTIAGGIASHAEGVKTVTHTDTWASHVEGYNCETGGNAEVNDKEADEDNIEGQMAHAEGNSTIARGNASHAEGTKTIAVGKCSHAQNYKTQAIGIESHAEGSNTIAEGATSHAEGYLTKAIGENSHAEGEGTITYNKNEHASGQYNISTKSSNKSEATHFSIGIGTSDSDRKNAFEVKQNGDIYIKGNMCLNDEIDSLINGRNADVVIQTSPITTLFSRSGQFHVFDFNLTQDITINVDCANDWYDIGFYLNSNNDSYVITLNFYNGLTYILRTKTVQKFIVNTNDKYLIKY